MIILLFNKIRSFFSGIFKKAPAPQIPAPPEPYYFHLINQHDKRIKGECKRYRRQIVVLEEKIKQAEARRAAREKNRNADLKAYEEKMENKFNLIMERVGFEPTKA